MQGLQGIQDFAESDYADMLRLMGFAYVDGVYSKELSEYYNNLDEQAKLEVLHFAAEFTVINNLYRLVTGKDWLSGEKNSRLEAAGWLALTAIPIGKLYSMSKEIKAGNKLLKGVSLTENELKILHNAGYFDEVKKVASGTGQVGKAGRSNNKVISNLESPVLDGRRVGSGAQIDDVKPVWGKDSKGKLVIEKEFPQVAKEHGFPDIIDNYPTSASEYPLVGGDGIDRKFFQLEGSNNGKKGVFEWIVEPNGDVSHRRFIDGGTLT
ncbi:hypothetical protein IGI42_003888 [Enterococcus sp. AZ109]